MHADHREAQEPEDTLSLILMINQRFHLNTLVEESTRGRVHKPLRWRWSELVLVSQTWGSTAQYELWFVLAFCILVRSVLCMCCGEISSVYAWKFWEISPTLVPVPSAKTKGRKQTNSSTGFKNQRAPIIYLNLKFNLTKILTQARLN